MDKCKIMIEYTYLDNKADDLYHTSIHTFTFDDYTICGDIIKSLKEKEAKYEYKHYVETP